MAARGEILRQELWRERAIVAAINFICYDVKETRGGLFCLCSTREELHWQYRNKFISKVNLFQLWKL